MSPVTVLTFNDVEKAVPIKERLEQAGIHARVQDDNELQKFWFMSSPYASVHLQVSEADDVRARQLLKEWDAHEGIFRDAIHCPDCSSPRVQYPQFTRKLVASWIGALLCAIGFMERKFYCKDCHFTWPVAPKPPQQPRDVLGWPKKEARSGQH